MKATVDKDECSYCRNCGNLVYCGEFFCSHCGTAVNSEHKDKEAPKYKFSEQRTTMENQSVFDRINDYVGNTGSKELNWKSLFTDVFKSHAPDEAEAIFICGTKKTTPPIQDITSTWPKPWLYSRVFLVFATAFILLKICWDCFNNVNVIPGLILVGAFTIPLTTLIMFLELNAFRNISLYNVMRIFFIGGCASLVVTLFLFSTFISPAEGNPTFINACIIGLVEELGKAIIIYLIIKHLFDCKYILNALLIGTAVGAGFAAFESAGYAFVVLLSGLASEYQVDAVGVMMNNIYMRGFLAPGGHVTWAAISAVALVLAKGSTPLEPSIFTKKQFWKIFIIPVACHALWDIPLRIGQEVYLQYLLLLAAIWIVVLIFINMGLNEVKQINNNNYESLC